MGVNYCGEGGGKNIGGEKKVEVKILVAKRGENIGGEKEVEILVEKRRWR